jgi:ribosome maturation factor RimP
MQEIEERLFEQTRTLVEGMGFALIDVSESVNRGRRVLCFYVDHPRGVSVEDCGALSRELAYVLDADPEYDAGYVLEVSSPGLDHRLRKEREYAYFAGRPARLVLREPEEEGNVVTGLIAGASDGIVRITGSDGIERGIPLNNIARARLVIEDPAGSARG